jgi:hypothetical protein
MFNEIKERKIKVVAIISSLTKASTAPRIAAPDQLQIKETRAGNTQSQVGIESKSEMATGRQAAHIGADGSRRKRGMAKRRKPVIAAHKRLMK